mgnify:FL=1
MTFQRFHLNKVSNNITNKLCNQFANEMEVQLIVQLIVQEHEGQGTRVIIMKTMCLQIWNIA